MRIPGHQVVDYAVVVIAANTFLDRGIAFVRPWRVGLSHPAHQRHSSFTQPETFLALRIARIALISD